MNGYLRSIEKFFNHNLSTRAFVRMVNHVFLNGLSCLSHRMADIHTLAEGEARRLYHNRNATDADVRERRRRIRENFKFCRRDFCFMHHLLRKCFRALYLCGIFRRTPHAQSMRLKYINDTADEYIVGANDCKINLLFFCKSREALKLHLTDRHILRKRARPAIAWSHIELAHARRLPQFPQE